MVSRIAYVCSKQTFLVRLNYQLICENLDSFGGFVSGKLTSIIGGGVFCQFGKGGLLYSIEFSFVGCVGGWGRY